MNRNYQKELDNLIEKNAKLDIRPKLMLHACCACCLSYVLEYLSDHFEIYVLYYNPNITEKDEYDYRLSEVIRLVDEMPLNFKPQVIDGGYNKIEYFERVKGLEQEREQGARCTVCFDMRLSTTAQYAKEYGCDYFATTLTISPLKNAELINNTGARIGESEGVKYLCSDFKKKNGYKRSIELSYEFNLYRQNYCGCEFSKNN